MPQLFISMIQFQGEVRDGSCAHTVPTVGLLCMCVLDRHQAFCVAQPAQMIFYTLLLGTAELRHSYYTVQTVSTVTQKFRITASTCVEKNH